MYITRIRSRPRGCFLFHPIILSTKRGRAITSFFSFHRSCHQHQQQQRCLSDNNNQSRTSSSPLNPNVHAKKGNHPSSSTTTTTTTTSSTGGVTTIHKQQQEEEQEQSQPSCTWIERYLPATWQPYLHLARVDKPIGTMLLLWPCCWSTALAAASSSSTSAITTTTTTTIGLPDPYLLSLFAVGAFTMRGAGCTINDLWDQKVDAQVARTKKRPLAAGALTRRQAWQFLALQLTAGLAILVSLPHTVYCMQWGIASLPLFAIYPAMKRFFPYPQLVLGLTFNWGAWMGYAAVHGSMDWSMVAPLYGSGVTWTLLYDTLYAHQDKCDDAKLGLRSTALTFGSCEQTQRRILYGFATATWLQWLIVGQQAELASIYYLGATAAYSHLIWQVQTADLEDPDNLADRFRSNSTVGAILFSSISAGSYFVS